MGVRTNDFWYLKQLEIAREKEKAKALKAQRNELFALRIQERREAGLRVTPTSLEFLLGYGWRERIAKRLGSIANRLS